MPGQTVNLAGTLQNLRQDAFAQRLKVKYPIFPFEWRKEDLNQIPIADDNTHFILTSGTHGSATPVLITDDLANLGAVTRTMRTVIAIPPEWDKDNSGEIQLQFLAGMDTNTASTSATLDCEAFLSDGWGAVSGSDLVTTAAVSINSATQATVTFDLSIGTLDHGSWIDVQVTAAVDDTAGSAVKAQVGQSFLLADIRGI